MWAIPDLMASMLTEKIEHPKSGATTPWVPSPTAATLHALHYHEVEWFKGQSHLAAAPLPEPSGNLLVIPLATGEYTAAERQTELGNNLQNFIPAGCQLADPWLGNRRPGGRVAAADGHDRGSSERVRSRIPSDGAGFRWLCFLGCTGT